MRKISLIIYVSTLTLISCGTVSGTLDAMGSILEGVATDARAIGSLLK